MLINIEKPKFTPSHKIAKINAEKLKDSKIHREFQKETEKQLESLQGRPNWDKVNRLLTSSALKTCGKQPKNVDMPWMQGHEEKIEAMRNRIGKWTAQAKEALTKFKGKSLQYLNAREEVRRARRAYQKLKRRWEKD